MAPYSSALTEEVRTLRNVLTEAHVVLTGITLPEGRAERCRELVDTALVIADHLQAKRPLHRDNAAVTLGRVGGMRTAERGSEYFRRIAGMRKTRAGGRPRKTVR